MLELIQSIFGEYTPIAYDTYVVGSDTLVRTIPSGMSGVNWPYVLGVAGFFLVLYCILRILGGVICGK